MYRSKHDPALPPTGTSFGGAGTTHPIAMNISGDTQGKKNSIVPSKSNRSFGKPLGSYTNQPTNFMKKSASTGKIQTLRELKRTNPSLLQPTELKPKLKPGVPKTSDVPVMNLVTSKNFVVANAVETILAAPKKVTSQAKDYLSKEDYGKVPKYLKNIQQDIQAEYDYIRMLQEQEDQEMNARNRPMAEEERVNLINGLKAKWEAVNTEYQAQGHQMLMERGARNRKEKQEAELAQLEKDIEKLNRKNIIIAQDNSY